jgi:RimJ/RimL family protein N-acetyltransferase
LRKKEIKINVSVKVVSKFNLIVDLMYSGKKVILRSYEMSDLDVIMKHWNNWGLRRYLGYALPISRLSEEEWLRNTCKLDPWKDGRVNFAMLDKVDRNLIGSTGLFNINSQARLAELGIAIFDTENFGKGYGTDALRVNLWVAFHILNLHSVHLKAVGFNKRGIRAYEKAGFKHAGVYRDGAFLEGQYHDAIVMDILREEFLEQYPPGRYVHGK